jgi:twinkle protein
VEGAEQVLLGQDAAREALEEEGSDGTLVLAFGELELLACYQAGLRNVVALPSCSLHQHAAAAAATAAAAAAGAGGADAAAAAAGPGEGPGGQFAALDGAWELLRSEALHRLVIAAPNDAAGFAAGEELARRIGKERCYRVRWPSGADDNPRLLELRQLQEQQEQQEQQGQDLGAPAEAPAAGALAHPLVQDPGYRLNALELLAYDGPDWLAYCLDVRLVEYPVQGLHSFADFWGEIYDYYMQQRPYETGVRQLWRQCACLPAPSALRAAAAAAAAAVESRRARRARVLTPACPLLLLPLPPQVGSGWAALDQYYRVVPGELTVVTGVPNSGKSEWLDALLVNLSAAHGWAFALCSFEKSVGGLAPAGGLAGCCPGWEAASARRLHPGAAASQQRPSPPAGRPGRRWPGQIVSARLARAGPCRSRTTRASCSRSTTGGPSGRATTRA